jgi:hypothetical protein
VMIATRPERSGLNLLRRALRSGLMHDPVEQSIVQRAELASPSRAEARI